MSEPTDMRGATAAGTVVLVRAGAFASSRLAVPAGILLVALGAHVRIVLPNTDVPITLQSLGVLLCGFWLRPRDAVAAMLAYLALGAAGLPVFTPGSAGLFGGTAGYLIGFVAAAWLVAMLKGGPAASVTRLVLAGAAGMAAVFFCGIVWRVVLFGGNVELAIATGLVPFLGTAAIQLGVAVSLVVSLRGRRSRDRGPDEVREIDEG